MLSNSGEPPNGPDMGGLRLFQIALSTQSPEASRDWYSDAFGLAPSGGMHPERELAQLRARGETDGVVDMAAIQGIPGAALKSVLWLVDQQDFFQLELMQYTNPVPRKHSVNWPRWRPCDIGYSMVSIFVPDFDDTLARLERLGTFPAAPPLQNAHARRACVTDPDGVLVEIMEDVVATPAQRDLARPDIAPRVRGIRLSVPDLGRSLRFFAGALCLPESSNSTQLHGPMHEAAWGLADARVNRSLLYAGDLWVELVQYVAPVGAPWPESYHLGDHGFFNIGLGSRDRTDFTTAVGRLAAGRYTMHAECRRDNMEMRYVVDDQGFGVQINYNSAELDPVLGFVPMEPER
jgi:catechol 2,3-dioxygenase-like lactoylglutathione lyase family enzyme